MPTPTTKQVLDRIAKRLGGTRASLKAKWRLDRATQIERASGKTKEEAREAAMKKLMRDPAYPTGPAKRPKKVR